MSTVDARHTVRIDSFEFRVGFIEAITNSQALPRFDIRGMATEAVICEIMRNMCQMYRDGLFDEKVLDELLLHDAGLICGYVTRSLLPE